MTITQIDAITNFCKGAKYFLVKFQRKGTMDFGKIIKNEEILNLDLNSYEIHRSIEFENDDTLFVYNLRPHISDYIDSSITMLVNNLKDAKIIETVYPNIFTWVFDGISVKAYARIPSGSSTANSTISRYGGTDKMIKIIRHHLNNIRKLNRGRSPDYSFTNINYPIEEDEISIGSINSFNKLHSVQIRPEMSYVDVLKSSIENKQTEVILNTLDVKYWAREINPDMLSETKHFSLIKPIEIDKGIEIYPPCIRNLMKIKDKGNLNRYRLARFLLSVHSQIDAKFMYQSVLSEREKDHIEHGGCVGQWNFICNNMKRYACPTCSELRVFCDKSTCKLAHPLQQIQEEIDKTKGGIK